MKKENILPVVNFGSLFIIGWLNFFFLFLQQIPRAYVLKMINHIKRMFGLINFSGQITLDKVINRLKKLPLDPPFETVFGKTEIFLFSLFFNFGCFEFFFNKNFCFYGFSEFFNG